MLGAWAVTLVLGYLVGSVPVAVLVARAGGVDPRRQGDRNPGYWNVKGLLGRRAAIPVFAGDVAKGSFAAFAGVAAGTVAGLGAHDRMTLAWAGTAAAMVGHAWPVFARFQGGRSILAFVGGFAVWSPRACALSIAVLAVVWAASRSFAWGARAGMLTTPLTVLVIDGIWRTAALGLLLSLIGLRFLIASLVAKARTAADHPDEDLSTTD